MKNISPKASSTPKKLLKIRARDSIHSYDQPSVQSPIFPPYDDKTSPQMYRRRSRSGPNSESELSHSDSESESEEECADNPLNHRGNPKTQRLRENERETKSKERIKTNTSSIWFGLTGLPIAVTIVLLGLIVVLVCAHFGTPEVRKTLKAPNIKQYIEKYQNQDEDLWYGLESGVYEIQTNDRPAIFMLLYKKAAKETLERILSDITSYSECVLNECSTKPITLTPSMYRNEDLSSDYGILLDRYSNELASRSVMIVKNLEKMPGQLAQAFHTFCDRYNPQVGRSLFVFTLEVEELGESPVNQAREILTNLWSDLKSDLFEPLFTRISSMVLYVNE